MMNAKELELKLSDALQREDVLKEQLAESHRALRAETTAHENTQMQVEKLAAENAVLKAAFDKPQAYLSWHAIPPTWEDPLPCGEYLDVHDEDGHKNSDGTDCWPVYAKPEIETPETDAFLAEVRAQGVEMFGQWLRDSADIFDKNYRHDWADQNRVSADKAGEFAAQLRKGVQS